MNLTLTLPQITKLMEKGTLQIEGVTLTFERPTFSAKGKDIHEFYTNGWNPNFYHDSDDAEVQVEDESGNWALDDETLYDLDQLGYLGWQGTGERPKVVPSFREAFMVWWKEKEEKDAG